MAVPLLFLAGGAELWVSRSGREWAPGKKGRIAIDMPPVLQTLEHRPERWATRVKGVGLAARLAGVE